jgi:hypothetical protein
LRCEKDEFCFGVWPYDTESSNVERSGYEDECRGLEEKCEAPGTGACRMVVMRSNSWVTDFQSLKELGQSEESVVAMATETIVKTAG